MSNIEKISLIKREKLDETNYLNTLINEAYNKAILDDTDITNIQIQLLELLDKVVYKYNGLESSSIKKEFLEEISKSNLYTISVYLKTYNSPDEAAELLKKENIELIYNKGRKRIERILNVIRIYNIKVIENRLNANNTTYNDTIIDGIKGFLKIYNPEFKAYDYIITADYPLFNNIIGKLEGAEFIEKYLKSIYLENKFCRFFSEEKIKFLLSAYSADYEDLIINIFEIVLLEAFACKLVNRDIKDLIISEENLNNIYTNLSNKSKLEIKKIIQKTYNGIKEELFKEDEELQEYMEKNISYISKLITNSVETNNLEKIFIIEKFIIL